VSNYRSRPKGNYIQEASLQELYMLTKCWKNGLDEIRELYESIFRAEHELFEDEVVEFLRKLKKVRYAVFNAAKDVLESEKPKYIWKYN